MRFCNYAIYLSCCWKLFQLIISQIVFRHPGKAIELLYQRQFPETGKSIVGPYCSFLLHFVRWIARENSEFYSYKHNIPAVAPAERARPDPYRCCPPLLVSVSQPSPWVLSAFCPSLCPEVLCGNFCPQSKHNQSRQKCCYLFSQISSNVSEHVILYWPFLWPKCQF